MPVTIRNKITAAGPGRIRALNRKAVLDYIRNNGPISRAGLIPALNLSAAAVSSVTNELVNSGFLRTALPGNASFTARGRPKSPLELNPDVVYALGLRLLPLDDQWRLQLAWIDYAGQIKLLETQVFSEFEGVDSLIAAIRSALHSLEAMVPARKKILAGTLAIPGVVSNNEALLVPAFPAIEGRSFGSALAHQIKYPISLSNDVNLAVLSELHAQPRLNQLNFAYLYIGSGVGAGIGLQGRLWSANGWAGEVGHIRINRGSRPFLSFEELLNPRKAFSSDFKRLGLSVDDFDGLAQAELDGDQTFSKVLADYAQTLFELITILCAASGLDEIIIDFPSDRLFSRLKPLIEVLFSEQPLQVTLSRPAMGDGAAVRGAAIAALDVAIELVESPSSDQASNP